MNRREKKKLKFKYLRKIDNALKQAKSEKHPNLSIRQSAHTELLEKLKNFIKEMNYQVFYEMKKEHIFPNSLSYPGYTMLSYLRYNFPDQMDKLFSEIVQRQIAFKILDI